MKNIQSAILGLLLFASPVIFAETYTYRVEKIVCASCIGIVKKTLSRYPEFQDLNVSLEKKEIQFTCQKPDVKQCRVDSLLRDLERMGYRAQKP